MITQHYEDILHLPHPVSRRRCRMTNYDRAAQFAPFAALTGYDAVIAESGRLTQERTELDEMEIARLDERLRELQEHIETEQEATFTWFCPDERKTGGAYIRTTGRVKKVDSFQRMIFLTDGRAIPIGEITGIEFAEQGRPGAAADADFSREKNPDLLDS